MVVNIYLMINLNGMNECMQCSECIMVRSFTRDKFINGVQKKNSQTNQNRLKSMQPLVS